MATPEEYVFRSDQEQVTEKWHTVLPDGNTYATYDTFEETVEREPKDREWFFETYAELIAMGGSPSFEPPAQAVEAVLIRTTSRWITETEIIDRRPLPTGKPVSAE